MAAINGSDALRFPPGLSARIATEIEAIAWARTDLLSDIPEFDPDPMYLASMYADAAAEVWETENDIPPNYLPFRIIDAGRKALIPRIDHEIDRRETLVWAECQRRLRAGRIDVNGVGEVPTYYELEDIVGPSAKHGHDSSATGWIGPEVIIMSVARSNVASLFHFMCPECGFTDAELGPAEIYEDHCEICLQEGRSVRLKCWPMEEEETGALRTVVAASWSALPRRQSLHRSR